MKDLFGGLRGARRIVPETSIFIPERAGSSDRTGQTRNGIPIAPRLLETLKGLAEGNYDYDIPNSKAWFTSLFFRCKGSSSCLTKDFRVDIETRVFLEYSPMGIITCLSLLEKSGSAGFSKRNQTTKEE